MYNQSKSKLDVRLTYMRWTASKTIKIDMRMRKIPLANPESVSIRP